MRSAGDSEEKTVGTGREAEEGNGEKVVVEMELECRGGGKKRTWRTETMA